ncbi:MAG: YidH family protein [Promethearchaeota archaeon]|jgi:putative membrane protein
MKKIPRKNILKKLDRATKLAVDRTVVAMDRTLLAWIRTSFAMIGFGFVIFRFLPLWSETNFVLIQNGPKIFGIFLIGLGTLSLLIASLQYLFDLKLYKKEFGAKHNLLPFVVGILVTAMGLILLLSLVFQFQII